MQVFCLAVHGDGLVKRREITFRPGFFSASEGLDHPLSVDAVVHGKRVASLPDGVNFVIRGVGDGLFGEEVSNTYICNSLFHSKFVLHTYRIQPRLITPPF